MKIDYRIVLAVTAIVLSSVVFAVTSNMLYERIQAQEAQK